MTHLFLELTNVWPVAGQQRGFDNVLELVDTLFLMQQDTQAEPRRVALVFGREVEGLSQDEIQLCDAVCSIPIGRLQESLSLGHAVSIVLSQIYFSQISAGSSSSAENTAGGISKDHC